MSVKYIIRLDDASEYINFEKWNPYFKLFDRYNIFPIIAVIPDNRDRELVSINPDNQFWDKVRNWQEKKYVIALHGYQHLYSNKNAGIMGINKYSEFAGIDYEKQMNMLQSGQSKFKIEGINTNMFVAPAHSFDFNTISALKQLGFEYISDGFFLNPIIKNGMKWIPQQLWKPVKKKSGVWTICIHPETLNEVFLSELSKFIESNVNDFVHPYSLKFKKSVSITEKLFSFYLSKRYMLIKIKNRLIR